jgi:hypothetical protein
MGAYTAQLQWRLSETQNFVAEKESPGKNLPRLLWYVVSGANDYARRNSITVISGRKPTRPW